MGEAGIERGFAAYLIFQGWGDGFPGLAPWAIFGPSLRDGLARLRRVLDFSKMGGLS
jgi:hypothetical protein